MEFCRLFSSRNFNLNRKHSLCFCCLIFLKRRYQYSLIIFIFLIFLICKFTQLFARFRFDFQSLVFIFPFDFQGNSQSTREKQVRFFNPTFVFNSSTYSNKTLGNFSVIFHQFCHVQVNSHGLQHVEGYQLGSC